MRFFGVIIGSEILDGRRDDSHFDFLQAELEKRKWGLSGVFIIEDDPQLMRETYKMLSEIPHSVIFSFGGIGATPDDYTRKVVAEVFRDGKMEYNAEFKEKIISRFGDDSERRFPLCHLPEGAELLKNNPVNGMYGFYLNDRFFFVPGFPEMAYPMVREALDKFYPKSTKKMFYKSIFVETSESNLISWMEQLPEIVSLSSLPKLNFDENGKLVPTVDIRIGSENSNILEDEMDKLYELLEELNV
jgi:molybdopterin-biosynthesis enzyme MoeA-like protein